MHIAALILPVFAVIVTGWIVGRLAILPRSLADGLVQFAYYVAMPALLFSVVAKEPTAAMFDLPFLASFGGGSLLVWAVVGAGSLVLARRGVGAGHGRRPRRGDDQHGFRGAPDPARHVRPTGAAAGGDRHPVRGRDHVPAGRRPARAAQGAAGGAARPPASILRHTLTNPMVAPTLLGLAYAAAGLTAAGRWSTAIWGCWRARSRLARCSRSASACRSRTSAAMPGRPACSPSSSSWACRAWSLAIAWQLQLSPFSAVAAVVCAAVPTAKTLFILSSEYDTGRELAAATIALTTLASVGSLLAWLVVLAHLYPSVFPVAPG